MKDVENKYKCIPFWSWNDKLDKERLCDQIEWMKEHGIGGFFMHARGGLKTEYLGKEWFQCIEACGKKAQELEMEAYAYDENGWPSGFVGGKLLEDIENHDRYLKAEEGAFDKEALVSYDISGERIKRVNKGDRCLNIYEKYSPSTVDILNGDVVDKFIELTHEEYKKRDNYQLKGFFTDEPQYYRSATPYTKILIGYFKETYNEDLLDELGLLFVEKEGYRAFRYKYWKSMQTLMLKNYGEKIYNWCEKNGYKLTGHYVEECSLGYQLTCCGGIMPFYEYEHIPGIDKLSRRIEDGLASKQLGSVASQLGKKQALCEMYAACGWDVTPKELKQIAESMYVNGVNLMCQHLLPYTEHGQRKRDNPIHFSAVNAWVDKGFKEFNDYFSVLGKILSESKEIVNVGVLNPITSCYFDYKREKEPTYGVEAIDKPYMDLLEELSNRQIPHHIIDETILKRHGRVEGKEIIVGECRYKYIIIPKIYTMEKMTERVLREYVKNGGKILLVDGKPEYLEGEKHEYEYLESNIKLDEIKDGQMIASERNENIRITHRKGEDGREFIYIVNVGQETEYELKVKGVKGYKSYDIIKDKYSEDNGKKKIGVGESYLMYFSEEAKEEKKEKGLLKLGEEFEVGEVENCIVVDFLRYSYNGKDYSEKKHHMGVFNEMLEKRYEGDLYLKYEISVKEVPKRLRLEIENTNIKEVYFNGKRIEKSGEKANEKDIYEYECKEGIKEGINEIVVKIDYYQSEGVYYALYGEGVTESLRNCLAYDTDIEAISISGDFGVYGKFKEGKSENVIIGEDFYISDRKKTVKELITEGYPFLTGSVRLKQTIEIEDTERELKIEKRFHLIDLWVNGRYVERMMFNDSVDLSKYLKKGKNEIEIELCISNRNKFGPFHTQAEEDTNVGPYTFERFGTWKDGKSSVLRESYSFVKTIL